MSVIDWIAELCFDIADWFEDAYFIVDSWISPFNNLAPPFAAVFQIFNSIGYYFAVFSGWVNAATAKLQDILSIDTIKYYLQTWIDYATIAYNWVVNSLLYITYTITDWWDATQDTVSAWIDTVKEWAAAQINDLAITLAPVITWFNNFQSHIPSLNQILQWFTNWWTNILYNITDWWKERLLDIKTLFNSWALDLAPFWEGWQEIRETVFNFLNNPLDWLLDKFTDWFLGVE